MSVHTPQTDIPPHVRELVRKRNDLRKSKLFTDADAIRQEIEVLGYLVIDQGNETMVEKRGEASLSTTISPLLILFGSGETSSVGRTIHEYAFKRIDRDPIRIGILTTPAGFQPNVNVVYEEIAEFFSTSLANFHPDIKIIHANTLNDVNNPKIVGELDDRDYIFTGPGSPTYAIKMLRNSLLLERIKERMRAGATLSLASAATIAFSQLALPVYEIYKVGDDLYWEDGLNLFDEFFKSVSVIPHYNNTEGGEKNDTSCCYLGQERFGRLLSMASPEAEIWGLDEHTAAVIDLSTKEVTVMGKGKLHELKKTPAL
jgi:cyanophycinase-like exopeptidase